MTSRLRAVWVLWVAALLLPLSAHSETYEQWQAGAPHQVPVGLTAWIAPATIPNQLNGEQYITFAPPPGCLFGNLDLSHFSPSDYPLKVRVVYRAIPRESFSPVSSDLSPNPAWTTTLHFIKPNASLGPVLAVHESDVATPAEMNSVPVWNLSGIETPAGPESSGVYSLLVEIAGRNGDILARQRLVEAVHPSSGNPTYGYFIGGKLVLYLPHTGAEAYLETMKQFGSLTAASELPLEPSFYLSVSVMWLDSGTLHDPRYDDAFWRRIFLAGVTVIGRGPDVSQLAARLGFVPDQPALYGGLWSVDTPNRDLATYIRDYNSSYGPYAVEIPGNENPFTRAYHLGVRQPTQLMRYSCGFLLGFIVFELAVLFGGGHVFSGPRRVWRWGLVPVSALAYTIVGLLLIHYVVDFRPEVEITDEIRTVDGWTDGQVITTFLRMGLDARVVTLTAPAQTDFNLRTSTSFTDFFTWRSESTESSVTTCQSYGRVLTSAAERQVAAEIPCHVTADRKIEAARPLTGAWVWDGRVWRNLGPMQPGHPLSISDAPVVLDPVSDPDRTLTSSDDRLPEAVVLMTSPSYTHRLMGSDIGLFLAIDPQAGPEHIDDESMSEVHRYTLLVHQFKLPKP